MNQDTDQPNEQSDTFQFYDAVLPKGEWEQVSPTEVIGPRGRVTCCDDGLFRINMGNPYDYAQDACDGLHVTEARKKP